MDQKTEEQERLKETSTADRKTAGHADRQKMYQKRGVTEQDKKKEKKEKSSIQC